MKFQPADNLRLAFRNALRTEPRINAELRLRRLFSESGKYVFVACMPRTGSTYLTRALSLATGFPRANLTYRKERNEQELYLPRLVQDFNRWTVTQQHVKATGPNLELFQAFDIRPVVLVRSIPDCIVSLRDHLLFQGWTRFPGIHASAQFPEWPDEKQLSFLVNFAGPWFVGFYVSWFEARASGEVDSLWLRYEDLRTDWTTGIGRVLDYYDVPQTRDRIEQARSRLDTARKTTRFNVGVAGRGHELLSQRDLDQLSQLASYYPWIDFGDAGL